MVKKYLLILLVSMAPLAELRVAIPLAIGFRLPLVPTYVIAIIGNMLPVPFILLFAKNFLKWGRNKKYIGTIFKFFLNKGELAGNKLQEKSERSLYWALFLFVGIPIPGTGAWTGTLAASLLGMNYKRSTLACMAGVILSGIIMSIASTGIFSFIR